MGEAKLVLAGVQREIVATRLPAYCAALGIPERGEDFAAALKEELTAVAAKVDAAFPTNTELSIGTDGLIRVPAKADRQIAGAPVVCDPLICIREYIGLLIAEAALANA